MQVTDSKTKVNGFLRPAKNYWTTDPKVPVKLYFEKDASIEPTSIVELFKEITETYSDHNAMMYKDAQQKWTAITYREYKEKVEQISKAFIKLGLGEHHSVGILAYNSPEWFIAALAAIHAHGIITGIYTTNSAEAVRHVLSASRANIVIVDDATQMKKIREIKYKLPNLKAVIQVDESYEPSVTDDDDYFRLSELEHMDVSDVEEEYQRRLKNVAINECCSMVFTSGTTGLPKGAMLTHDNIIFEAKTMIKRFNDFKMGSESIVSYLPLSHVAAQVADFYNMIAYAGCTWFADRDALKGSLVKTLQDARPTRFFGVPRVYEKMQEKMLALGTQNGALKRKISQWAKDVCLYHYLNEISNDKPYDGLTYRMVRCFIMSKIKHALGLDRCLTFVTGAAPMSLETKKYFLSLDMKILDAFGMSETSAAHIMSPPNSLLKVESIGLPLNGCDVKILNPDEKGHGELCLSGRNIFIGYVDDEAKTREALDENGYMHSGDIAYGDNDGYVYITGRIKELIITAGGENIPPVLIENLIKAELPGLSNVMLIGERRKFLTVLVTLKTEIDPKDMSPKENLTSEALQWMKELNLKHTTVAEILAAGPCPHVLKSIDDGIARANKHAISKAQKVQKFTILPHDFSIPTGELGPTLKLKRNEVVEKYKDVIEAFYKE